MNISFKNYVLEEALKVVKKASPEDKERLKNDKEQKELDIKAQKELEAEISKPIGSAANLPIFKTFHLYDKRKDNDKTDRLGGYSEAEIVKKIIDANIKDKLNKGHTYGITWKNNHSKYDFMII
jgi:hypothetical protein